MTDMLGATLDEIRTQTEAWAEALQVVQSHQRQADALGWSNFDRMIFCGCGSTYYLSLSAAALWQSLVGKYSQGVPSSEALLCPASVYLSGNERALLLAISRSGTTSETLQAVSAFKKHQKGTVVTVTNYEDSPLAQMGSINFSIPSGKEQSVAQTKSFASMLVTCTALAMMAGKHTETRDILPTLIPVGKQLLERYEGFARETGQNHEIKRFFFLGSGYQYGLASEASLKMKEMSLSVSEPFHFLEFRHGPISMVDQNTLVVGLLSDERREYEEAVLRDVKKLGGQTLTLGETNTDVSFHSGIPESARGVLYLPFLQLMAYYRAKSFGLNPDQPRNLTAVVELDFSEQK